MGLDADLCLGPRGETETETSGGLDEWKKNTQECDQLYSQRQYQLLDFDQIDNIVSELINQNQMGGRRSQTNNRCSDKLKNGQRCRNRTKNGVYCWLHQ